MPIVSQAFSMAFTKQPQNWVKQKPSSFEIKDENIFGFLELKKTITLRLMIKFTLCL